jgi:hypothetical protein
VPVPVARPRRGRDRGDGRGRVGRLRGHRLSVLDVIADEAAAESALWAGAVLPAAERGHEPVFSPLAPREFALGLETVYEAYLAHYGSPRVFAASDADDAILLGDYLYAHGLVRIEEAGGVDAVSVLADLISTCAALRANGAPGDGQAWVDAARALGGTPSGDEIARALERHSVRVAA